MTRHETFPTDAAHDLSDRDLVLATDLDGTFLGGDAEDRTKFYAWIESQRHRIGLIFVTGRDPGFIRHLTREKKIPRPDYVVGDVGTTIAAVSPDHFITPIEALEAPIAEAWGDAGEKVQRALQGKSGLRLQSTLFRHRVSYDLDPVALDPQVMSIVENMGLDALISDNRFFDVLPRGVSKGPSLRRLLEHLGVPETRTLVAGDTLNDLSMLELGLPAVAVGGSEPALVDRIADLPHIHIAKAVGVAGIAEAIVRHALFPARKETAKGDADAI
jgi:HAD superfamily hydrolase (TIGR01484 family)